MLKKAFRVGAILVFLAIFMSVLPPGVNSEMTLSLKANWTGGILPKLADLNGDGINEIITTLYVNSNDKVSVWNGSGTLLDEWPASAPSIISPYPAVGDINNDSKKEIVFGDSSGILYVYNATGTLMWSNDSCYIEGGGEFGDAYIDSSPVLVDMNNDNFPEIIFSCKFFYSHPYSNIYAFDWQGNSVSNWETPVSAFGQLSGSPAVSDINGDRNPEIVVVGIASMPAIFVQAFFSNGTQDWLAYPDGNPSTQNPVYGSPIIKDIDGDKEVEIILASYNITSSKIYLLNSSSGLREKSWGVACSTDYLMEPSPLVLADGGNTKILYYCNDTLYAWNGTGYPAWNYTVGSGSGSESCPAIGDINNDTLPEILVPTAENLSIFSDNGSLLLSKKIDPSLDMFNPRVNTPVIGDVGWDGKKEIVISKQSLSTRKVFVLEIDTTPPQLFLYEPRNITYASTKIPISLLLSYSANDSLSGVDSVWYSVDGGGNITLFGNTTFNVSYYGPHSLTLYANDTTGNTNSSSVTFSVACQENWSNCSDWSTCSGGIQTRTCTDANSCGTNVSKPAETQSCTVPPPPSSGGSSGGGGGSPAYCSDGKLQKWRGEECEKGIACNGTGLVCNVTTCKCMACQENWSCSAWGECSPEGFQTRACTDNNKCGTTNNKSAENRPCVYKNVNAGDAYAGESNPASDYQIPAEVSGTADTGEGLKTTGLITGAADLSLFALLAGLLFLMILFLLAIFFVARKRPGNRVLL